MPWRHLTVETLREELLKFRIDFSAQEAEMLGAEVRATIRRELDNYFEERGGGGSDAPITKQKSLPWNELTSRVTLASQLDKLETSSHSPSELALSAAEHTPPLAESPVIDSGITKDFGWTARHRKSYMCRSDGDDVQQVNAHAGKRHSKLSRAGSADFRDSCSIGKDQGDLPERGSFSRHSNSPIEDRTPSKTPGSSARTSVGTVAGKRQDLKRNSEAIPETNPAPNELDPLSPESDSNSRRQRKAKRMSTIGQDGVDLFPENDVAIGPYNITCSASSREKASYSPLVLPTGADAEQAAMDPARFTVWLTLWAPIRSAVLKGYRFDYIIAGLIILNAISIGVQTDYMARNWTAKTPWLFRVLNLIFCAIFTVEILIKLCVHGWNFFQTAAWRWNIFDAVVVSGQFVEESSLLMADIFEPRYAGNDRNLLTFMLFSVIRTLRIFRLIRVMRIVSIMHLVGDLRKFVVAITDSMQSLGWTVLLLLLITYIFAVYLTQLVTDHKVRYSERVRHEQYLLQDFYGSLDKSMLSLYETISDGIHWHEVMDPLKDITPWLSVLFAVYISGIVFALMNVVTGIFVDSAIRAAETDKKRDLVDSMRHLFEGADEDGNGTLTFEEFEGQLGNPLMQGYLQAIDLDEEEAVMLFQLLDIDESGEIEADDFVSGCIKLHGGAKAIDLAAFVHEYRRTAKQWNAHFDLVERSLSWLCEQHRALALNRRSNIADRERTV